MLKRFGLISVLCLLLALSVCLTGDTVILIDKNITYDSNASDSNGLDWNALNEAIPWADVNVADDITLTNITQITNRSYNNLQDLPDLWAYDTNYETNPDFNSAYVSWIDGNTNYVEVPDSNNSGRLDYKVIANAPWSTSEITVTVNRGSFAADATAYLFVIDADGIASSGKGVAANIKIINGAKPLSIHFCALETCFSIPSSMTFLDALPRNQAVTSPIEAPAPAKTPITITCQT